MWLPLAGLAAALAGVVVAPLATRLRGLYLAIVLALAWGRNRILRWMGGVALFGLLAYLFTPLSAAGAEGAPVGFGINIRYAIPALLLGLVLLPLARGLESEKRQWWLLGGLLLALVATNRADAVLRDPDRLFAWALAVLLVLVPAALLVARSRGASPPSSSPDSPAWRCWWRPSVTPYNATTCAIASASPPRSPA